MIKSKIVFVVLAVLSLLNTIGFAREPFKPGVNVTVIRDGITAERVILSKGSVRVFAPKIDYDEKTNTYALSGFNTHVIVIQDSKHSIRLSSDKIVVQADEIQEEFDGGDHVELDHFSPVRAMIKNLQEYPRFSSYRVDWYLRALSFSSSGIAIYDPSDNTLTETIDYGSGDSGKGGTYYRQYTNVTPKVLQQWEDDQEYYKPKANSSDSVFQALTHYGCDMKDLGSTMY